MESPSVDAYRKRQQQVFEQSINVYCRDQDEPGSLNEFPGMNSSFKQKRRPSLYSLARRPSLSAASIVYIEDEHRDQKNAYATDTTVHRGEEIDPSVTSKHLLTMSSGIIVFV